MHNNIEIEISALDFRRKLQIKDGLSIKGERGDPGLSVKGDKGNDGSPDTPDEVIEKVNKAKKKIEAKQIKGLQSLMKQVEDRDNNPVGKDAGGGPKYVFRSNGTIISDHVTEIDYTTGITATYSGNGRITLSASSVGFQQPTSGTVNGSNQTFVWATAPNIIVVDGVPRQKTQSDGFVNWTGTTTTLLTIAPNFDVFSTA